eukprot:scaffold404260_cov18-Prasinocladus_malaysianus.AAC.1
MATQPSLGDLQMGRTIALQVSPIRHSKLSGLFRWGQHKLAITAMSPLLLPGRAWASSSPTLPG